jgi:glutathione synthase/RimK-type ligase-like ATP-grasp enzyme
MGGIVHVKRDLVSSASFFTKYSRNCNSIDEQLDRSQWSAFLRGLAVFDRAMWVNHPQASYMAESKPYQLRIAHKLGFHIPGTLITNDAAALSTSTIGDPFILKSIDTILLRDGDDEIFAYSSVVTKQECLDAEFSSIPSISQCLLQPKVDLRVTVIGETVHAIEITDKGQNIHGDWRLLQRDRLWYQDTEISNEETRLCVELVRTLGLRFGAIDMARTSAGNYFIEINPTGEWGWLDRPSRPISGDIASLLAQAHADGHSS